MRPLFPLSLYVSCTLVLTGIMLFVGSCKKYVDEPGKGVPQLSRKYCNDPEAVNFNRDFPGTADNSVCYFPADAFSGTYSFTDSIYIGKDTFLRPLTIRITAQGRTKFSLAGLCESNGNAVTFTANRALRASADTTIVSGQALCRPQDTVSGFITQSLADSSRIQFYLTVVSDTGASLHRGTAFRQ